MAAVQGRHQDCATLAADALTRAKARRIRQPIAIATWALALADLSAGRWSEALAVLEVLALRHSPEHHPIVGLLSAADLVEAAVRLDRIELARENLAILEEFVRTAAASWTLALRDRCRALLADGEAAAEHFEQALQRHQDGERRFDEARTQLLYGEYLRRARRRAAARHHLRSAIEIFQRLDATPWEERAGAELRATGETARKRDPSTLTQLTPQQMQIMRLVAGGASNKDVAAQLFLSPRTVDYHLRNMFVKLGITSRAELTRVAEQ